jgi:hypothetical protein
MLFGQRQMGVIAAGDFGQRGPRFHRDVAVGFRGQHHDHFGGVDVAVDTRSALGDAFFQHGVIERRQRFDLVFGIPADALAAVAEFVEQRPDRGEFLIGAGIVALDHH